MEVLSLDIAILQHNYNTIGINPYNTKAYNLILELKETSWHKSP